MHIQKYIILFRGRSHVFILHFMWPISCKSIQSCFTLAWFIPDWLQAGVTATVQMEPGKNGENLHPPGSAPAPCRAHMSLELRR